MSWALRRQLIYFGGLVLFVGIVFFFATYSAFHQAPTCMDGKQNGDELAVDCGGACSRLCMSQVSEPIILWSRAFPVTGSDYNLFAYVENQNKNGAVYNIPYEFRVYDTDNKLIGRRQGSTFIPANQRFGVFEARFDAGTSIPKSVTFSFTGPFVWYKKAPTIQTLPIRIDKITFGSDPASPTLTAQISNDSIYDLPEFDVMTVLYDSSHNAINVSKTHKDGLKSNETAPILFTWPNAFSDTVITKDILPQINPFLTSF